MRRSLLLLVATAVMAALAVTCHAISGGGSLRFARAVWPSSTRSDPTAAAREELARADQIVRHAAVAVDSAAAVAQRARARSAQAVRIAETSRRRVRILSSTAVTVQLTPEGPESVIAVPPAVVDRMDSDSTAVAELQLALAAGDSLVVRQRSRIVADSLARAAAATTIGALDRTAHPRCGRRCGVAIGVVALVGAAVAVGEVKQLLSRR